MEFTLQNTIRKYSFVYNGVSGIFEISFSESLIFKNTCIVKFDKSLNIEDCDFDLPNKELPRLIIISVYTIQNYINDFLISKL